MIEVTTAALAAHPMLQGMSADHLAVLARSASDVAFPAGYRLFEEGGSANHFWLIQSGLVGLDLHVPGQGRARIDTVGAGELLGWSWRFAPYRWARSRRSSSTRRRYEPRARRNPSSVTNSLSGSQTFWPSGCNPPGSG